MTEPSQRCCECGHYLSRHYFREDAECDVGGCDCKSFNEESTTATPTGEGREEELKLMIAQQGNGVSMNQCIEKVRSLLLSERERVSEEVESIKNEYTLLSYTSAGQNNEVMKFAVKVAHRMDKLLNIINKGNTR